MLGLIFSVFLSTAYADVPCQSSKYGPTIINGTETTKLCHKNYLSQYSEKFKDPIVVNWTLTKNELSNCNSRNGSFSRDPLEEGKDVSPSEYTQTGYDRGHLSPAEDNLFDDEAEHESFYFTR